jgi:hypothetical protein
VVPSYVEEPESGQVTMGETDTTQPGDSGINTDFYLYIENPVWMTEIDLPEETELYTEVMAQTETPEETELYTEVTAEPETEFPHETEYEIPQETDPDQTSGTLRETESESEQETSGKIPKTGDYGMNKNSFLYAALIFGAGYLLCDEYEKRKSKK